MKYGFEHPAGSPDRASFARENGALSRMRLLARMYRAALAAVDPESAVAAALARPEIEHRLSRADRVGVFAVGKAAAGMARAARSGLGPVPLLAVIPRGAPVGRGLPRAGVRFAAHPEPDSASVAAAREALSFFRGFGPEDVVLCLISGGASSLLALPRPGLTLAQKRRAIRELVRSGASIAEVNRRRRSLSAVKGGRLGRATPAALVTLVISDVPGDDPALVGSGPTIRRRRSDLVRVVASNRDGLDAAAREARTLRLAPRIERQRLTGEARVAGARLARKALHLRRGGVLLAGGETVVRLDEDAGRGGRCLELALGAAPVLAETEAVGLLAAGSDGVDGSSGAAGAFADGRTLARAAARGFDPDEVLRRHDSSKLFAALGDLLVTGPTGTNVGDWVFALRSGDGDPGETY